MGRKLLSSDKKSRSTGQKYFQPGRSAFLQLTSCSFLISVYTNDPGNLPQYRHSFHDHQRIVEMSLQHGIRDHNELRNSVSRTFLYDLGDADIVVSENSRDIRQSARLVRNLKAEEISRSRLFDRFYRIILICNAAVPSTVNSLA